MFIPLRNDEEIQKKRRFGTIHACSPYFWNFSMLTNQALIKFRKNLWSVQMWGNLSHLNSVLATSVDYLTRQATRRREREDSVNDNNLYLYSVLPQLCG